jgi:hypothetical protein
MRSSVAALVAAVALVVLSTASGSPSHQLVPSAVAFRDRLHGELGLASPHCSGCTPSGAIAVTSDGGKTWRVVEHTDRRVTALAFFHDSYYVGFEHGRRFLGRCPGWFAAGYSADFIDTNLGQPWSVCGGEPGAGNEAKAVFRGKTRVAYTPMTGGKAHGGISRYGYPVGVAGSYWDFGIIWETRGTLYVTRDGGHHWHTLPKIARPEIDFGSWATVLSPKVGFVLLYTQGRSRLIETTDAGRTWHIVHRWR